jgi:RsiW-degrading membrane proteinase PrsW (M82 family)
MLTLPDLCLGAVPAVLWLAWVRRKDARAPEPRALVLLVFLLGGFAAIAQNLLRPRVEYALLRDGISARDLVLDAFVVTAASEEILKACAFTIGAAWCREWDEPLDGVVYGAAAGLGFAAVENAYFLAATGETAVVWQRGFTATFAHVAFSAGFAFCVGLGRLGRVSLPRGVFVGALYAIGTHGAYDLLLARDGGPVVALLGVLPVLMVVFTWKVRSADGTGRGIALTS